MTADWIVPHNRFVNRPQYEDAALRVLRSGHVAQGPEVEAFECELAERFRPDGEACCVSSGSAALRLAVVLLDPLEVRIPTYGCISLWHAAEPAGMGRDLVDCAPDRFVAAADATIVTHTFGELAFVPEDAIEDFTPAAGFRGAGSRGVLSAISFGATKPLGIGAGGALLGPSDLIAKAREMRDYDRPPRFHPHFHPHRFANTLNWQMSDLHAAIGRARLERLEEENAWRWRTARQYSQALGGRKVLTPEIHTMLPYRYVIRTPWVDDVKAQMAAHGVETIVPITQEELLHRRLGGAAHRFPVAEGLAHTTLSIPIWPGMSLYQVSKVCQALQALRAEAA